MNLTFETRWYSHHEIMKLFGIKDKTWRLWLYDKKTGKKKDLNQMGIYKLPGSKYWVVNPVAFQDWFNEWIGAQ